MKNIIIMLGEIILGIAIFGLLTGGVQDEVESIMNSVVDQLKEIHDDTGYSLPSVDYFKNLGICA